MASRIVQIIEARGWFAGYKDFDGLVFSPLVCWALVEDEDGDRRVVGIDADGDGVTDLSDSVRNFAGYTLLNDASEQLERRANNTVGAFQSEMSKNGS